MPRSRGSTAFQGGSRLFVVPFGSVQRQLATRRCRPPAGDRSAAADDADRLGARRARRGRSSRHGRLARPGLVADAPQPRASSRMPRRCPCSARSSPGTSPRSSERPRTSARTRSRTCRPRTAARCSRARWPRRVRLRTRLSGSSGASTSTRRSPSLLAHGRARPADGSIPRICSPLYQTHYAGNMER